MRMHVCFMATTQLPGVSTHRAGGLHENWVCYGTLLYYVTRLSVNGLTFQFLYNMSDWQYKS